MSKDVYYFSHDCNARNDPKILALRSVYGAEGYAFYFMLLEIFREQENYKLRTGKYLFKMLSIQTGIDEKTVEGIMNGCLSEFAEGDSALLKTDGEYIWSDSFIRRMEMKDEFKYLMSELGKKGAEKRWRKKGYMAAYGIKEKEIKENKKESKEKDDAATVENSVENSVEYLPKSSFDFEDEKIKRERVLRMLKNLP